MEIFNKTPHEVNLYLSDGKVISYPVNGEPFRLASNTVYVGMLGNIPITKTEFGACDLPKQEHDTYYIVSLLVKQAYPKRNDLIVPNELVRNDKGQIVGCKSFIKRQKKSLGKVILQFLGSVFTIKK